MEFLKNSYKSILLGMLFFVLPRLNAWGLIGNEPAELYDTDEECFEVSYDWYGDIIYPKLQSCVTSGQAFSVILENESTGPLIGYLVSKKEVSNRSKLQQFPYQKMWISLETKDDHNYWYFFSFKKLQKLSSKA